MQAGHQECDSCRADQNHAQAFHHHGASGGLSKASSGTRKSFCLMADQAQKIALHTTSALPPATKFAEDNHRGLLFLLS